jgi:hypothetical protein
MSFQCEIFPVSGIQANQLEITELRLFFSSREKKTEVEHLRARHFTITVTRLEKKA